jgi:hypothetical protein
VGALKKGCRKIESIGLSQEDDQTTIEKKRRMIGRMIIQEETKINT